ncbi:hypothetical protein C9374_010750 [Naegleria lovaniensis]|uniref:Nudix hydrolase domain-containing protein n=1 Tax=Naegleria lovaniensis TaxID=51637 RepID=A0AA88KFX1_NAELO|nr:uncharacterized protein C9374_010750 [Naegleria lovaniensis]KAG2374466.1 hypothetical protein C9374_010750 [Naegleria lovaniensis]
MSKQVSPSSIATKPSSSNHSEKNMYCQKCANAMQRIQEEGSTFSRMKCMSIRLGPVIGMDPLDAVKREVQEELGLSKVVVTSQDLIGVYNFAVKNEIIIVYHVQVCEDSNEEIRIDTNELSDFQLVRIDKVRPWKAGTGYALRDWLLKKGFTENANNFIDPFQKKESVVDTTSKL